MMENRSGSTWQGMTIKDILEKVDLSSFIIDDETEVKDKQNKGLDVSDKNKVKVEKTNSAYLGPKLWETSISLPLLTEEEDDQSFDVMNMDEFLAENNLSVNLREDVNWSNGNGSNGGAASNSSNSSSMMMDERSMSPMSRGSMLSPDSPGSPGSSRSMNTPPPMIASVSNNSQLQQRPNVIVSNKKIKKEDVREMLKGDNEFLYAESKRARLEREKMERKRKFEVELDFAPEDLALATVPGMDFDPKRRAFDMEELRPQPIIKKRSKTYVPEEKKDEKYWQRRLQNNYAAKRSREARRLKENQITLRAAYLEKENTTLKKSLEEAEFNVTKLQTERDILRRKLAQYEPTINIS